MGGSAPARDRCVTTHVGAARAPAGRVPVAAGLRGPGRTVGCGVGKLLQTLPPSTAGAPFADVYTPGRAYEDAEGQATKLRS